MKRVIYSQYAFSCVTLHSTTDEEKCIQVAETAIGEILPTVRRWGDELVAKKAATQETYQSYTEMHQLLAELQEDKEKAEQLKRLSSQELAQLPSETILALSSKQLRREEVHRLQRTLQNRSIKESHPSWFLYQFWAPKFTQKPPTILMRALEAAGKPWVSHQRIASRSA